MANNCLTWIVVEVDNRGGYAREVLRDFAGRLRVRYSSQEWQFPLIMENFGLDWRREDVRIRGDIYEFLDEEPVVAGKYVSFSFSTLTAWHSHCDFWDLVVGRFNEEVAKKYGLEVRFFYQAEEPGCSYYVTNDAEERYFGRWLLEDEDGREYCSQKEIKKILREQGVEISEGEGEEAVQKKIAGAGLDIRVWKFGIED